MFIRKYWILGILWKVERFLTASKLYHEFAALKEKIPILHIALGYQEDDNNRLPFQNVTYLLFSITMKHVSDVGIRDIK